MAVLNIYKVLIFFIFTATNSQDLSSNIDSIHDNIKSETNYTLTINVGDNEVPYFVEHVIESESIVEINVEINKTNSFGYIVFQVHSFLYKLILSYDGIERNIGRNLGFVLFDSRKIYLKNSNKKDVNYVIAITSYNSSIPVSGGCNLEGETAESPLLKLSAINGDILQVDTPFAALSVKDDPDQKLCSNTFNQSKLSYVEIYHHLPKDDFSETTYFNAIKMFLVPNYDVTARIALKKYKGPANRKVYLQMPEAGMLFNTFVSDSDGNVAAYVPTIVYSCNPFFWKEECNLIFNDVTLKCMSIILIIMGILKNGTLLGYPPFVFVDIGLECFTIGAYFTYKFVRFSNISEVQVISNMLLGGICVILLTFTIFIAVYHFNDDNGLLFLIFIKLYSAIIFASIFAMNVLYIFEINDFNSNDALYYVIYCVVLLSSVFLLFKSFAIICLIINIIIGGYYLLVGIQINAKSNLIYIPLTHFYKIHNPDYGFANGYPIPNMFDIYILVAVLGVMLLIALLILNNKCLIRRCVQSEEQRPLLNTNRQRN